MPSNKHVFESRSLAKKNMRWLIAAFPLAILLALLLLGSPAYNIIITAVAFCAALTFCLFERKNGQKERAYRVIIDYENRTVVFDGWALGRGSFLKLPQPEYREVMFSDILACEIYPHSNYRARKNGGAEIIP